jgi:hypothetical protein
MNTVVFDAKILSDALDKLLAVVPVKELSTYGLSFGKKRCKLIGHDQDRTIIQTLASVRQSGEGDFFFTDPQTLKQSIKSKDEVELTFDSNLVFKSGRFKADMKLFEPSPATLADIKYASNVDDVEKSIEVDHEFFKSLGDGVKISRLKDPYNDAYIPSATIVYDGSRLTVMGTTNYHLHVFTRKLKSKKTPDIMITIPTGVFAVLDKLIKDDAKFFITDDRFCIKGNGLVINLPPIETETPLELIEQFVESLGKPLAKFDIGSEFAKAYEGISAFFRKGVSTLSMKAKDKKLFLKYQNDNGSVEDVIKINSNAEFSVNIDPAVFADTYKNIKQQKTIEFSVYGNKQKTPNCYHFKTDSGAGTLNAYGYFKE